MNAAEPRSSIVAFSACALAANTDSSSSAMASCLQAISIGHRDRFRKVEEDIFALIRRQANAAAVARVEIERETACRPFNRPIPGGAMNRSAMHRHVSA